MSLTHDENSLSYDAYSSAGARNPRASLSFTRVYRKGGQYAHLEEAVIATGCEREEEDGTVLWYGTGSQREIELAARKPLCLKCFRWREASFTDERLGAGHGTEMS